MHDRRRKPSLRSDAERNRIVEQNINLAYGYVDRYWGRSCAEFDDYVQAATLGLMRAAELWRPEIGEFSTIAWFRMRQAIQQYRITMRLEGRYLGKEVSNWAVDFCYYHAPEGPDVYLEEKIDEALRWVPPRFANIMRRRLEGHSLQTIGQEFGLTKERIRQILVIVRTRLCKLLKPQTIEGAA